MLSEHSADTKGGKEVGKRGTHLLRQGLWTVVYPCNEPSLLRLIHPRNTGPAQVLHELGEGDPAGSVHVQMVLVLDKLLIDRVRLDALRAEAAGEELDEVVLELGREIGDVLPGTLADNKHLPEVGLGLRVTLEAILVSALFLADLAVPPQTLEALGLHLVGQILWCSDYKMLLGNTRIFLKDSYLLRAASWASTRIKCRQRGLETRRAEEVNGLEG